MERSNARSRFVIRIGTKPHMGLLLIAIFYVAFFPTSIGGHIIGNMWMVRNLTAIIITVIVAQKNKIIRKPFYRTLFLLVWMTVLTITTKVLYNGGNNDFSVAWASMSGLLPTLLFWCVEFDDNYLEAFDTKKVLHVFSIILLVWGWGLVLQIAPIVSFTSSFYSQLHENMFTNMVILRGKPVMSFGTHSMSAFFMLLVFYLHCVELKERRGDWKNYVYMALLFALVIPMRSNTALLAMGVMAILFLWTNNTHVTRIIALLALAAGVVYAFTKGDLAEFIYSITRGTNSQAHGIAGRYLNGIFTNNIQIALNHIGVGFLRSDSGVFRMNDSGIIYLFSQGNIVLVILSYSLMYGFMKRNMMKYSLVTFLIFFLWEFIAASTFISVKMVFAQVLTILIVNSICLRKEGNNDVINQAST